MIEIQPNTEAAYKLMHDGILALARAERQGMRIDMEYCERKHAHITRKIERMEKQFRETKFFKHWQHSSKSAVNIFSGPQLGRFLYSVKKLQPAYTTASGQGSTDEEALQQLNIPELNALIEIRKLKKIRDTYLEGFMKEQVDGYIHPFFNLHLVRTFRSSSDSPNFQNIPKRNKEAMLLARRALFPRPGHQLMEVDYSGIEVRIAACYHEDPTMLEYIHDPTKDMHRDMAVEIFKLDDFDKTVKQHSHLRAAAKNGFVFPQFYGDYYGNNAKSMACNWGSLPEGRWKKGQGVELNGGNLADHLISQGVKSYDDFVNHIKNIEDRFWNVRFPVYQKWKELWWQEYQRKGFINMHTGFRCSGLMGKNDCINYPVQGAAFHCLLWSLIRIDAMIRKYNWKTRIIGQIHDAIVFDVYPPELEIVARNIRLVTTGDLPRAWNWINVPLDVEADLGDVDASWADLKPYELPTTIKN